ncbi:Protein phosphatase 2C [Abditibacterium utsteinense]|uniref:Protein phosphatase 2C n=2 Tax=Abditibacterium utsteinense TaxID=1960156 RepID=A0A2S8SQA9_9BACT|nr:Protein phosphatase 2C [Abditibacterium utsteinense]
MNPDPNPENVPPILFTPVSPSQLAPREEVAPDTSEETLSTPETIPPSIDVVPTSEPFLSAKSESVAAQSESIPPSPEAMATPLETVPLAPQVAASEGERVSAAPENPALAVSFSPAPDAPFQSSLSLSLVCARENAPIFYALGARDIGQNALRFDPKDKILLTSTIDIAARAFENGEYGPLLWGTFEIKKPLWQEIEPADRSDATPHKLGENGECEDGWKISAGSVRGKLHAHRGLWREDAFGFSGAQNGEAIWQIAAVSDGAGSAPLSRVGSRIACEEALAALRISLAGLPAFSSEKNELQTRDLPVLRVALMEAASAALGAIRVEAAKRGQPLSAFAATLLVLVRREWNGAQLCASVQVGDGVIALRDEIGLTLLGVADHGQHSSETRFLTTRGIEAELASRVAFSIKNDLRAFALFSDGVSDDYFPEDRRLGEVFDAVLPLLQSENDGGAALVAWLGYEKKGSSDDRTLVVGWKDTAPLIDTEIISAQVANAQVANAESANAESANAESANENSVLETESATEGISSQASKTEAKNGDSHRDA